MAVMKVLGRLEQCHPGIQTACETSANDPRVSVILGVGEEPQRLLEEALKDLTTNRVLAVSPDRSCLRELIKRNALSMANSGRSLNSVHLPTMKDHRGGDKVVEALKQALELFLAPQGSFLIGQILPLVETAAITPLKAFQFTPKELPVTRSAIVIGATDGIGKATVQELAKKGIKIGLIARRIRHLREIAKRVREQGGIASFAQADVTHVNKFDEALRRLTSELGCPDALIYAAGLVGPSDISMVEHFHTTMAVNFSGFVQACRTYIDLCHAGKRRGRIVAIGSVSADDTPLAGVDAYCASKGAVLQLVRALSISQAKHGIVANCISPGPIDTAMTRYIPDILKKTWIDAVPLGRFGKPCEVAHVISYIATQTAPTPLTGQNIYVDGGFHLTRRD